MNKIRVKWTDWVAVGRNRTYVGTVEGYVAIGRDVYAVVLNSETFDTVTNEDFTRSTESVVHPPKLMTIAIDELVILPD